jgi:hypothetical protein
MIAALLMTACSSGPGVAVTSPGHQKALAYSQCMRSHAAPGWPDPNSQGMVSENAIEQVPNTPQLLSAEAACAHLQPSGHYVQMSSAQLQKLTAAGLRFSNCMRAHEVPNFPGSRSAPPAKRRARMGNGQYRRQLTTVRVR